MGKKVLTWIFVAGVLLLSVTLVVGIVFAGPAQAGANEVLSKAPVLVDEDGKLNDYFLNDTATWLKDHFFGRQELISVHNKTVSTLFATSASDDVILGRDGWLYYEPTLGDYTGTSVMDEREVFCAANNLALMEEYCRSQGKAFAFVIAPNKNSLYPDNMPDYGAAHSRINAQALHKALEEKGVAYVDLFAAFDSCSEVLYFAHDSHWNSKGAAFGADCINAAFGVQSNYYGGDFSQSTDHLGDLYEMLYPSFGDTEKDPVYGGQLAFSYTGKATKPDSITLETASQKTGSLLCYRDSFGNLLYPYLADSYGTCRFSRSVSYDLTLEGDCVLIELVERNISYLYTNLPLMPAPQREVTLPEASATIQLESKSVKNPEGMFRVKGTLPVVPDEKSSVYVICDGAVYEAFCLSGGGFGAYVPGEAQGVACYVNGELTVFSAN